MTKKNIFFWANFYVGLTTTLGELGLGELGWANLDWAKPSRPIVKQIPKDFIA